MLEHKCKIEEMKLLGSRHNPISRSWPTWALAICHKCGKIQEWQIHSEEGMLGGALECTAFPSMDYVRSQYGLDSEAIASILSGQRRPKRYDWHKGVYSDA